MSDYGHPVAWWQPVVLLGVTVVVVVLAAVAVVGAFQWLL